MAKGDEFEDRDRQERGDRFPTSGLYMAGKRKHGLSEVPLGAPPVGFDVRSTFEVRPVLSHEFSVGVPAVYAVQGPGYARYRMTFVVPGGYVAVLRNYQFWISDTALTVDIVQIPNSGVSIIRNEQNVSFNLGPNTGVAGGGSSFGTFYAVSGQMYPTFTLADENTTLGIDVILFDSVVNGSFEVVGNFYGTLLLKSGVAYELEIANKLVSK